MRDTVHSDSGPRGTVDRGFIRGFTAKLIVPSCRRGGLSPLHASKAGCLLIGNESRTWRKLT